VSLTTKFIPILKIVERVINMKNITIEENTLVISCDGSSDIHFVKSDEGLEVSFDYGACSSEHLTNEDIDLLISFLKNSKS